MVEVLVGLFSSFLKYDYICYVGVQFILIGGKEGRKTEQKTFFASKIFLFCFTKMISVPFSFSFLIFNEFSPFHLNEASPVFLWIGF